MKKRIQTDSALLSLLIILTAVVCWFYRFFPVNQFVDSLMDFLGMMLILKGAYVRMAARGHKRANSVEGKELVTTGTYSVVRNPMYLGTFVMGAGFVLVLWPWWILPIYSFLFYLRFKRQINKEEVHLRKLFGARFEAYVRQVPPMFPSLGKLWKIKPRKTFPWAEVWSTKEKYNLIAWPASAFILELLKDQFVLGSVDVGQTLLVFAAAVIFFTIGLLWKYSDLYNG